MEWLFIFYNTLNDADLIRCVKEAMNKADCVDMTEAVENDSGYRAFSCRYFTVSWFKDEKTQCLIWDNGEYIFDFIFSIDYDTALQIAESIKQEE